MVDTALPSNLIAKRTINGVNVQHRAFTFANGVNADNDTWEIARLPANSVILDVKLWITDLDSSTDMEIDVGLNPTPGSSSADANVLADGLTTAVQSAGKINALAVAPTIASGVITAGVGITTHATLDSDVFLTFIDNGDATSGTIYSQVWYSADCPFDVDVIDNT
jgi:hypothetical protein